jgi:hypothetical protein
MVSVGRTAQAAPATMTYNGGQILAPRLAVLYWGTNVPNVDAYLQGLSLYLSGQGDAPGTAGSLEGLEPTVAQYGVHGAFFWGSCTDTTLPAYNGVPGHANGVSTVQAEIDKEVSAGCLPGGYETLVVVVTNGITWDTFDGSHPYCPGTQTAPGSGCPTFCASNGFCAYHQFGPAPFAVVPTPSPACITINDSGNNATNALQVLISHEVQEAATNPDLSSGWHDSSNNEIGDGSCQVCSSNSANSVPFSFGRVQAVADNLQQTCSVATFKQYPTVSATAQVWTFGGPQADVAVLANDYTIKHGNFFSTSNTGTWESLGNQTFRAPPVIVAAANALDVFAWGDDGSYWHTHNDGSTWSNWSSLGGIFLSPPAAASWGPGRVDIVGEGLDGSIYHGSSSNYNWSSFSGWEYLGGVVNGPPTIVSRGSNLLDIFVQGLNSQYFIQSWNGSNWTGWSSISFNGEIYMNPPVVVATSNTLDIFGLNFSQRYVHRSWANGAWNQTLDTTIPLAPNGSNKWLGPPAAVRFNGQLDLMGLNAFDSGFDTMINSGAGWSSPNRIGGGFGGATFQVVPTTGDLDLFVEGTANQMFLNQFIDGWHVQSGEILQ